MEESDYEFRSTHERVNEWFAKHIAELRGCYANGDDVTDEVLTMLQNWVNNHIRQEDENYATVVQQTIARQGGQSWVSGMMKKLFG